MSKKRFQGLAGARKMGLLLSSKNFDTALALQTNWPVAIALSSSGIPTRIGPRTHFHSYFAYNYGMSQHRSRVEMHEAEYNLQLLRVLGLEPFKTAYKTSFGNSTESQIIEIHSWLQERSFPERHLVGIHPGMGGSALNWPLEMYVELVKELGKNEKVEIALTGSRHETALLQEIAQRSGEKVLMYLGQGGLGGFSSLVTHFKCFVAPSTGPLHVAVAVKTPVVALFPPVKVQSALRWGPFQTDASHSQVMTPEVNCGEVFRCAGAKCPYFFCMRNIYPLDVLQQIERFL